MMVLPILKKKLLQSIVIMPWYSYQPIVKIIIFSIILNPLMSKVTSLERFCSRVIILNASFMDYAKRLTISILS